MLNKFHNMKELYKMYTFWKKIVQFFVRHIFIGFCLVKNIRVFLKKIRQNV